MTTQTPISDRLFSIIARVETAIGRKPAVIYVSLDEWVRLSEEHGLPHPIDRLSGVPLRLRGDV